MSQIDRLWGRNGSDEKRCGAQEQKIAFYGHPSSSPASIGGSCLTLLPLLSPRSLPLLLCQAKQVDMTGMSGITSVGQPLSLVCVCACNHPVTDWTNGLWSAEAGRSEPNHTLYTLIQIHTQKRSGKRCIHPLYCHGLKVYMSKKSNTHCIFRKVLYSSWVFATHSYHQLIIAWQDRTQNRLQL